MDWLAETDGGVMLNVTVRPRSSKAGLDGAADGVLKVRVRSAPVDGKANREVVETLAEAFGLPKSRVVFRSGETSKRKRILLAGATVAAVRSVVGA